MLTNKIVVKICSKNLNMCLPFSRVAVTISLFFMSGNLKLIFVNTWLFYKYLFTLLVSKPCNICCNVCEIWSLMAVSPYFFYSNIRLSTWAITFYALNIYTVPHINLEFFWYLLFKFLSFEVYNEQSAKWIVVGCRRTFFYLYWKTGNHVINYEV